MDIENWDEVRTAYHVARLGTVSGAADALGVHHATVIRHIDALEGQLGVKLFQRHARGYTATEAGLDLLRVAQATADQFEQLAGRLHGQGATVMGELVLTTVEGLSSLLLPVIADFQRQHCELTVRLLSDSRLFRLEYGEAHVAIRAGKRPEDPDNIVQSLAQIQVSLYASESYIAAKGMPSGPKDFADHVFVGPQDEGHRANFNQWMRAHVPPQVVRTRASDARDVLEAIQQGCGIGFVPNWRAGGLVEVLPARPEWQTELWLITHVDLHRTPKVQAFTTALKEAAKSWS